MAQLFALTLSLVYWEDGAEDETEPWNRNVDNMDTTVAEATIEEDQVRFQ